MERTYTGHFACFVCRKSFKRPLLGRWIVAREGPRARPRVAWQSSRAVVPCPDCSGPTHSMGKYFKAPARDDIKGWERTLRLFRQGHFHCSLQHQRGETDYRYRDEFEYLNSPEAAQIRRGQRLLDSIMRNTASRRGKRGK